ncbi:hypothetical protein ACQKK5_08135 [Brevibacillus panacihumi]|uniref:hypothetical protein n=1 Tax=Brevibacillus panacihumi TaxID=497735 RepID=UPI003D05FA9F
MGDYRREFEYWHKEGDPLVRDEVAWFAIQMEKQLRANEHKGGWESEKFVWLFDQLNRNSIALAEARTPEEKVKRAANVANFAMMISDIARKELT